MITVSQDYQESLTDETDPGWGSRWVNRSSTEVTGAGENLAGQAAGRAGQA